MNPMKRDSVLWMRLGDSAEYQQFGDDIDAVIDVLREANIGSDIRKVHGGIATENYSCWNYISLYWGDKDSDLVKVLSDREFKCIEEAFRDGE